MKTVFIFNGAGSQFPGAVFFFFCIAADWIKKHSLTGVLTSYPIDMGVYEWAIEHGNFKATHDYQKEPKFIQKFTSASLKHYHFEDGTECK